MCDRCTVNSDCEGWDMMLELLSEKDEADTSRGVRSVVRLPEITYLHAYALYQRNHGTDREESYAIIKVLVAQSVQCDHPLQSPLAV